MWKVNTVCTVQCSIQCTHYVIQESHSLPRGHHLEYGYGKAFLLTSCACKKDGTDWLRERGNAFISKPEEGGNKNNFILVLFIFLSKTL